METKEISNDKENPPKRLDTRKITGIVCSDVISATFVRVIRTISLSAFNTFGMSFQNSGDSIVSSILQLFQNLIQEL